MPDTNRKAVETPNAPKAIGPYSQAIKSGGLLFCSGQIPLDPKSGEIIGTGDVEAQTRRVMENLKAVLEAGGASFGSVLKTTIFIKNMGDFAKINAVYGAYFEGLVPPARATVEVARLPRDVLVEIDMIAAV